VCCEMDVSGVCGECSLMDKGLNLHRTFEVGSLFLEKITDLYSVLQKISAPLG
jgi:hypothetical protein